MEIVIPEIDPIAVDKCLATSPGVGGETSGVYGLVVSCDKGVECQKLNLIPQEDAALVDGLSRRVLFLETVSNPLTFAKNERNLVSRVIEGTTAVKDTLGFLRGEILHS
jgi:hypothetical protein